MVDFPRVGRTPVSPLSQPGASQPAVISGANLSDSAQTVFQNGNTLELEGTVRNNGIEQSSLAVQLGDGQNVVVMLERGMTANQTARALAKAVRPGYTAKVQPSDMPGTPTRVTIARAQPESGAAIRDANLSDSNQTVLLKGNALELEGTVVNNGIIQSSLHVELGGGEHVNVMLQKGMTANQTARALKAALPEGYTARVVPSDFPGTPTRVFIERQTQTKAPVDAFEGA